MTTSTCNSDVIKDFLADRLSDVQQVDFEQHLNSCGSCCAALQSQAADVQLWDDAKTFLSSVDGLDDVDASADAAPAFDLQRLDFLAPTDDPRMLGRFGGHEISGVIGCGGMGIVLKGFDGALNRYAAIKVLAPHYATSGAARQRFAREAQAAAAVVHDNVIAIHGVDEFNNLPYLVMPYVKGDSLQKRIDRAGPLTTAEVLRIGMQTAKGLSAAHDQGLVHRDIKPGNILLPENVERVVITDFGLARAADDASLTRSGVIAGTPQYMSPEQARGEGIDHRSDLFSLGSVMYAMCTGHPPFRAETPYGILRRITDNAPRPIRDINPDVPVWLCGIIDRLLAKEASRRFSTADEVATLFEECLAHVQQPMTVPLPASVPRSDTRGRLLRRIVWLAPVYVVLIAAWILASLGSQKDDASEVVERSHHAPGDELRGETFIENSEIVRTSDSVTDPRPPSEQPLPTAHQAESADYADSPDDLSWFGNDDLNRLQESLTTLKMELADDEAQ